MGVITFCGFDICRPFSSPPELIGSGKKSNVMWITLLNTTKKVCHGIMLSTNTLLLVPVSVKLLVRLLHYRRNTITKYLHGDYEALCQKDFRSEMD